MVSVPHAHVAVLCGRRDQDDPRSAFTVQMKSPSFEPNDEFGPFKLTGWIARS